jgi:hypothetical protein
MLCVLRLCLASCASVRTVPVQCPATAEISTSETGNTGVVSSPDREAPQPTFDPTDALIALADHADAVLASCRYLYQAVPGFASAP